MARLPKLPDLLHSKIYKTGQTRGADDDQIFQNRVARNSTVLIPFRVWETTPSVQKIKYENCYIVLISPTDFENYKQSLKDKYNLNLGENLLVFYELRRDWDRYPPDKLNYGVPKNRTAPLEGHYVARIADTTALSDKRINHGYTSTDLKGAGIRQFEYACKKTIQHCRTQLEALFWLCVDAETRMESAGMSPRDFSFRKSVQQLEAKNLGLFDVGKLQRARIVNDRCELVCPLCLEKISAAGFLSRLSQPTGRERHDLTVTQINLFHIEELTYGALNHRPYNLGWGHHHCNVVCKDSGISDTLSWMATVLNRNYVSV